MGRPAGLARRVETVQGSRAFINKRPPGLCKHRIRRHKYAIHRGGRARVWPPGDVLRLARGCPRLTSLDYSLDPVDSDDELPPLDKNLSVADQSHVDDLFDLLESRCREANIPPRFQIKLLV